MKDKGEKGSFTVEAILSLSIFMFAFVTIVSLATVAKIESTTQYAIDQTAKEISKYPSGHGGDQGLPGGFQGPTAAHAPV